MRFPKRLYWIASLILLLIVNACSTMSTQGEQSNGSVNVPEGARNALLRVTATGQSYIFHRPWQQRRPVTQTAIGTIVGDSRVLVHASLVANNRYIELETLDTHEKQPGRVAVVDYEANLALVEPLKKGFPEKASPLALSDDIALGDRLTVWQVKPDGDIVPSSGKVTSVELGVYTRNNFFLSYRMNSSLQYRLNNLTLPVVKDGRLAGLVLRQNTAGQTIEVIATSVIRHFLEDANDGVYQGFPTAGFHFGQTLDPQLRRYIGLPESVEGIYVQKVIKGGPADRAGLQAGDVIAGIGDVRISNTGHFQDKAYGSTSVVHLLRTLFHVGDKVPLTVFRKGEEVRLNVVLDHRSPDQYLVPSYIVDRKPDYLIVGGMVLQELSVPYLMEYGNDWATDAPIHLLYYLQNQDYLNGSEKKEKIVILTEVIPTPYSIGFEELSNLVIEKVNGQAIGKLDDVRKALAHPLDGFHKIELQQHPKLVYLDPAQLPLIDQIITQRYRIPVPPITR